MRTSLKKLKAFGMVKQGDVNGKLRRLPQTTAHFDDLQRATQDMQDMRDCYDSLLSAAAATANSAYEFSESLKEMGSCLLEKTSLNEDDESGKVLLMMGKVQFELLKLVDKYRSHIFQTITSPSESLLNELRTVEEMKRLCDEKRTVYEYMMTKHKEKGRMKSRKGDNFSTQELQTAYNEYDEEATLFVFRLKSLKQGQSRSLLTQAARHHASQLCFFQKGLQSLQSVEPYVKSVTEQQHIDYQFSGLDDDVDDSGTEDDKDDDDGSNSENGDGQLTADYVSRDFMELDKADATVPHMHVATPDEAKENPDKRGLDSFVFGREMKASSHSAPIFAEKKFDPAERVRQMRQLSSRKSYSYVLPTPGESKSLVPKPDPQVIETKPPNLISVTDSTPLEQINSEKNVGKEKMSASRLSPPLPPLKENNNNIPLTSLPTHSVDQQRHDQNTTFDARNIKRQAFSGPLTDTTLIREGSGANTERGLGKGISLDHKKKSEYDDHLETKNLDKSWPNKRGISGIVSTDQVGPPQLFSGPLLTPAPSRSSSSAAFMSSPQINELHELPRPPPNRIGGKFSDQVGYSGPLFSKKSQENNATNRSVPKSASPLPPPPLSRVRLSPPPLTMARSFSIPTSKEKGAGSPVSMPPLNMLSPPLTPVNSSSIQPASPSPER